MGVGTVSHIDHDIAEDFTAASPSVSTTLAGPFCS